MGVIKHRTARRRRRVNWVAVAYYATAVIAYTSAIIAFLFFLWGGLSFAEVLIKNLEPAPTYSRFNAVILFLKMADAIR